MSKLVLSVGQCGPDHASLSKFLNSNFDVRIVTADLPAAAQQQLADHSIDLVLINRKLDADYSDGMEILRAIKANPATASIPVMIVSNFDDAQQAAVAEGAIYGIGKAQLDSKEVRDRVAAVLGGGM